MAHEIDTINKKTQQHTPTPYPSSRVDLDALMTILLGNDYRPEVAQTIVRAVNAHEELLRLLNQVHSILNQSWDPKSDVGPLDALYGLDELIPEAIARAEGK